MRCVCLTALVLMLAGALTGCDGWCWDAECDYHEDPPFCDYPCQPAEWGGCDCSCEPGRDCGWDEPPGWCGLGVDCPAGQVCHPDGTCLAVVTGCPLTDECLADPEGYTPQWQGIDPEFVGTIIGDGLEARVYALLDFYPDHLYGTGTVVYRLANQSWEDWLWIELTGTRDGDQLSGQILDASGMRTFDATFSARLLSASEIEGTIAASSDEFTLTAEFQLARVSPCGCETTDPGCAADADCADGERCDAGTCVAQDPAGCTRTADCPAGQVCLDGECVALCLEDADCPAGQLCVEHECVPGCQTECCAAADCAAGFECRDGACVEIGSCAANADCLPDEVCLDGQCTRLCDADQDCPLDQVCNGCFCVPGCRFACCAEADCPEGDECVEGECRTPCTHRCECEAGEVCQDGYCLVPDEEPPPECITDCDCDYAAGYRCVDGICQPS